MVSLCGPHQKHALYFSASIGWVVAHRSIGGVLFLGKQFLCVIISLRLLVVSDWSGEVQVFEIKIENNRGVSFFRWFGSQLMLKNVAWLKKKQQKRTQTRKIRRYAMSHREFLYVWKIWMFFFAL